MFRRTAFLLMLAFSALAQPAAVTHEPTDPGDAAPILGREVLDPAGQPAGRVVDVLVDATGATRAAIVDFGGFLGIGQRRIAVVWRALFFNPSTGSIVLQMSADAIADAPEYKPGAPALITAPPLVPTPPPPK